METNEYASEHDIAPLAAMQGPVAAPAALSEGPVRFLLVSGKPIEEPVAWYGPIVMNTKQELQEAMADLQRGTFIK